MKKRCSLRIHGRVQMVGFRFSTRRLANKLGIKGWVKNNSDGTVSAVLEGEEDKIKELIEFCKKGPTFAKVKDFKTKWERYKGEFNDFEVKY